MPTPRLSLPYIVQSQAQKEVTHAEALNVLDALVQAAVETRALSVPPANPVEGALYLVGVNPTGAWSGRGNMLAQWIGGAWAFRAVAEGFRLWLKDEKTLIIWTGTAWATYPYASAAEIFTRTASFAVSPTIGGATYRCDATAAAIIASLPLLADVPVGFQAKFRCLDASANAVTMMPAHNLLPYSEAFDDAAWVKAKLSVQANAGYAPDNILDADWLIEDTTSGNHEIRQDFTKAEGVIKLVAAIAARSAGRSQIYLMLDDGTATNRVQIRVDLTGGTIEYSNAAGTLTLDASGTADLGSGWRLLWLAATLPSASGTYAHRIRLYDGVSSSYAGDGASGVFLSRAQLCNGSAPIPYLETTTAPILETIAGADSYLLSSQTETVVLTAAAAEWIAATIADPPAGSLTLGNATASAANALAAGEGATASASAAIAIGDTASASAADAIAIGDATASSATAIAIGESASASNTSAIAIGEGAGATGADSVAIGHAAVINGNYNVGIGYNAKFTASQLCNIGIGYNVNPGINADADFDQNILIGRETLNTAGTVQKNGSATPNYNTFIGCRAVAGDNSNTLSIGSQNALIGYYVTHIMGNGAAALGSYNVAMGSRNNELALAGTSDALAVGNGTVTLGSNNNRNTQGAVTVGDYAVAIGYSSNRNSVASTALTVGARSIAIGNNNNYDSGGVIGENAIAIGSECDVSAESGIAIGRSCVVAKQNAVALGKAQTAVNAGELAFGTSASHGMVTYVLAATTTDGSTVELTTDGANFIAIPAGKVFCFEAFQTTWNRTDGAHQVCRFSGGVIKNSAGTVTLVKAPAGISSDGTENQIAFAADDANDRLAVTIAGTAGKTIETRVIVTGAFLGA
ncbi:MAG: DUF2793 domain-containing protein [Rhodospirillales bacterium]|nr:DUF2793 domain-containing protein [Rhodospirillales bacterium]